MLALADQYALFCWSRNLSQTSWTDQHQCDVLCDSKHGVMGAGEGSKLPVKGLFYGIGHQPNSQLVAGQIDLDEHGYVKVLFTPLTCSVPDLHSYSTWLTQTRPYISDHVLLHPFITHSLHTFVMVFNVVAAPDGGYVCYLTCL